MNKKNWLFIFLACTFALTFNACKKSDDTDTTDTGPTEWERSTVFTGDTRSNAAYFQIGETGYVVGGVVRNNSRVNDAWSFSNGQWASIEDFPGEARHSAIGFVAGGKGYVGLGTNGTDALSDFWEYDPETEDWAPIAAELPKSAARYGAVAFTLGNYAYVGLGSTESGKNLSDFYRFDPDTKTWEEVSAQFEWKRTSAFAFVIGNKAYVGGGTDNNQFPDDFYSFDGDKWTKLNKLNRSDNDYTYDITRYNTSTFTIGNYGYVVGGRKNSVLGTVWKYDPASDSWTDKHQVFQGSPRESAASFSIGGKGYVVTGMNGAAKFDDNWVFTPVR